MWNKSRMWRDISPPHRTISLATTFVIDGSPRWSRWKLVSLTKGLNPKVGFKWTTVIIYIKLNFRLCSEDIGLHAWYKTNSRSYRNMNRKCYHGLACFVLKVMPNQQWQWLWCDRDLFDEKLPYTQLKENPAVLERCRHFNIIRHGTPIWQPWTENLFQSSRINVILLCIWTIWSRPVYIFSSDK